MSVISHRRVARYFQRTRPANLHIVPSILPGEPQNFRRHQGPLILPKYKWRTEVAEWQADGPSPSDGTKDFYQGNESRHVAGRIREDLVTRRMSVGFTD